MGLYNFQKRFAPKILSGFKQHTIRGIRAHADKPGNILHLYTGLRTSSSKLIFRVPCVGVQNISIEVRQAGDEAGVLARGLLFPTLIINDVELSGDESEELARRDGFESWAEMVSFWRHPEDRLPFHGQIIHWRFSERLTEAQWRKLKRG